MRPSGFGLATAQALAELQVNLILLGRREERLNALAKELLDKHSQLKIQTVALDVRKYDGVRNRLEEIMQQTPIDILINNARVSFGIRLDC